MWKKIGGSFEFCFGFAKKIGRSEKFSSPPPKFCAKHHAYFSCKSIDGPQKRNVMIELKILILRASYCGFLHMFSSSWQGVFSHKNHLCKKVARKILVFRGLLQVFLEIFHARFLLLLVKIVENLHVHSISPIFLTDFSHVLFRFTGVFSKMFHGSEMKVSPRKTDPV